MKENKFKENLIKICVFIFYMIPFLLIGLYLGFVTAEITKNDSKAIFIIAVLYIMSLLIFMFHVIIHEAGHLVFGLLSGYEFVSFRIGSLTLIKENGKFRIKKFSIPGTAGQCLMMPPEGKEYDCPYFLYNLGGILTNAIFSIIFLIICLTFTLPKFVEIFFMLIVIIGFSLVLTNGIPFNLGSIR